MKISRTPVPDVEGPYTVLTAVVPTGSIGEAVHAIDGGHSLRRGMAPAAHRAGADYLSIARQGGWTDGSRQLYRYIEEAGIFDDNPLRGIGL